MVGTHRLGTATASLFGPAEADLCCAAAVEHIVVDLDSWAVRYGPASVRRAALTRPGLYSGPESRSDVLRGDAEAEMLVDLWSQCALPADCLQQIGASSCQVASRPAMDILACIGNGGENLSNCTRGFEKVVEIERYGPTTCVPRSGTVVSPHNCTTNHARPQCADLVAP